MLKFSNGLIDESMIDLVLTAQDAGGKLTWAMMADSTWNEQLGIALTVPADLAIMATWLAARPPAMSSVASGAWGTGWLKFSIGMVDVSAIGYAELLKDGNGNLSQVIVVDRLRRRPLLYLKDPADIATFNTYAATLAGGGPVA